MMTREGGAQPKEYLAKYAADRVRTVSTAWLGSTMLLRMPRPQIRSLLDEDFYSMRRSSRYQAMGRFTRITIIPES